MISRLDQMAPRGIRGWGARAAARALIAALAFALPLRPAGAAADEPEVAASVDRDELALDETLTLSLVVTTSSRGDAGELQPPALRDFDVVSRSTSEQVSFAFGSNAPNFRRTAVTTLQLTPHRAGALVIEPARLAYHGQTYSTAQIAVRVLPAGRAAKGRAKPPPSDPYAAAPGSDRDPSPRGFEDPDPPRVGSRDLMLRGTVDNPRPFAGQQVTYSLWLLARVNVSGIDKLQLPRMDGFWAEEIESPQQLVGEARVVDGVPVQAYLLRRRALFPLRPGKLPIDAAQVDVLTGMGLLFARSSVHRAAQPLELDVQPLPSPRPPGFDDGNVGQWSLSASVDPPRVSAGQPVTFRLVLSGRGNLHDVQMPALPQLSSVRAYDATVSDKPSLEDGRAGGTRTVEQLLVPERMGDLELPSLALPVFDPTAREYKTLRTPALHVAVGAAGPSGEASLEGGAAASGQNLLASGGFRPIRLRLARVDISTPPWTSAWFWSVLLGAPLALGLVASGRRALSLLARDPEQRRVRGARGLARKRLREAESLLGREGPAGAGFHAAVAHALSGYLSDGQGLSPAGLTRDELAAALSTRGHRKAVVDALFGLLDECDRARFAPGARERKSQQALLQRADALLVALDRGRKGAA